MMPCRGSEMKLWPINGRFWPTSGRKLVGGLAGLGHYGHAWHVSGAEWLAILVSPARAYQHFNLVNSFRR